MGSEAPPKEQSSLETGEQVTTAEIKKEVVPRTQVAVQPTVEPVPRERSVVVDVDEYFEVRASAAMIRTGPGIEFEIIKVVYNGEKVQSLGDIVERWMRVKTDNSVEGWIARSLVRPAIPQ